MFFIFNVDIRVLYINAVVKYTSVTKQNNCQGCGNFFSSKPQVNGFLFNCVYIVCCIIICFSWYSFMFNYVDDAICLCGFMSLLLS